MMVLIPSPNYTTKFSLMYPGLLYDGDIYGPNLGCDTRFLSIYLSIVFLGIRTPVINMLNILQWDNLSDE